MLAVLARLGPGVRFHLVTQSSGEPGLVFLRGLVRVLAFERPGLRATLVDCDARSDVDVLARELRSDAPDDEVRWRHDVRYAARLTRVPLVDGVSTGPGAYVITGGFGALGRPPRAGWQAMARRGSSFADVMVVRVDCPEWT